MQNGPVALERSLVRNADEEAGTQRVFFEVPTR